MALSNWDTLAVNEKGSCNGEFVSDLGVEVAIYKNWLYVGDKKAWVEGGHFVESTIMQINEGNVLYKDITIIARRGPQNGIFCAVWQSPPYPITKMMLGCGVYGFSSEDWVGVDDESFTFLKKLQKDDELPSEFKSLILDFGLRFNQGDAYIAERLGIDKPQTEVGKSDSPLLMQMLGTEEKPPK